MTTLTQEYELQTLLGAGGMGEVYLARVSRAASAARRLLSIDARQMKALQPRDIEAALQGESRAPSSQALESRIEAQIEEKTEVGLATELLTLRFDDFEPKNALGLPKSRPQDDSATLFYVSSSMKSSSCGHLRVLHSKKRSPGPTLPVSSGYFGPHHFSTKRSSNFSRWPPSLAFKSKRP